jgi:hypothetical protein
MTKTKSTCSVDGCERIEWSRGWCNTHYAHWRAHGDPVNKMPVHCVHCGSQFERKSSKHTICSDECRRQRDTLQAQCRPSRQKVAALLRCRWCDDHFVRYMTRKRAAAPKDRFKCTSCSAEGNDASHTRQTRARPSGRKYHLKSRYGLTVDAFNALVLQQLGQCLICRRSLTDARLAVDHDHNCCPGSTTCGKCIRGVLCHQCNVALGLMGDSPDTMRAAAQYLEQRTRSAPAA